MRHLSVPSQDTEDWLLRCRREGWLAQGGVLRLDDGRRGIPLNQDAPAEGAAVWEGLPVVDAVVKEKEPSHWQERLPTTLRALDDSVWPSAYEVQGDVLMVKVEGDTLPHEQAMAQAMLSHFPNIRLVCADEGVDGDFRVRQLRPLASKDGSTTTRTRIREHGATIWVDPQHVYFSARLSSQRQETVHELGLFRERLHKPMVLADPYAGVGPAFPQLMRKPDLMAGYLAGDLNPAAVDLLRTNLEQWSRGREHLFSPKTIVCKDARKWKTEAHLCSQANAVLVNLPHDSFEHLPDLFALFDRTTLGFLRGWAIIERHTVDARAEQLQQLVEQAGGTPSEFHVREVKGFSSTRCFVVFQTIIAWD